MAVEYWNVEPAAPEFGVVVHRVVEDGPTAVSIRECATSARWGSDGRETPCGSAAAGNARPPRLDESQGIDLLER